MRAHLNRFRRVAAERAAAHPLLVYLTLAYAFSWLLFVPMIVAGTVIPLLIVIATFGPSGAAILTHWLATGSYRAFRVYSRWPRMILGTVVGCVLIVLAYVVLPGLVAADPRQLKWSILASTAVYNISTLLGGPVGEEPGWRGYALPRLETQFGPVKGSLIIAVCWAGWHLPLFLIPGWTSSPLWVYVLILIGLSIIMTYGVNLARFSVIAAIAMHAAFNTVSRFLAGLFVGTQPRVQNVGLLLALSGLAAAVVLLVVTRGRLAYQQFRDDPAEQMVARRRAERPNPPLQPTAEKHGG